MSKRFYPDITTYFQGMDAALDRGVKRKRASRSKTVSAKKVSPSVKKYVARAIIKAEEVKVSSEPYAAAVTTITAVNSSTMPIAFSLLPSLPNGDTQGTRVGNSIKVKELRLKGCVYRRGAAATDAPLMVRLYIGRLRDNLDTPVLTDYNRLFYGTNGAETNASSQVRDTMYYPIQSDYWDIKYVKTMFLGLAGGTTTYSSNDVKTDYEIDLDCTKYVKKLWKYSAGNNYPQNEGLFAFLVPWTMDESAPAGVYQAAFALTKTIKYSDS